MKLDFDVVLLDPKGDEFTDRAKLGAAVYAALAGQLPTDVQQPADKRLASYRLLQKVAVGGEQEITVEEAAEIKDRASKLLPLIVFGAIVDALEAAKVSALPKAVNA